MMDLIGWLGGGTSSGTQFSIPSSPGMAPAFGWLTVVLSAAVASGYIAIAVNWHFQRKLEARAAARAAAARLVGLVVAGVVCGYVFYATDMAWQAWRLYDAFLLLIAWRT